MIQNKINELKKESEIAESLLMKNIKSIPSNSILNFQKDNEDVLSSLSVLTSPKALSIAKILITLGTGLSSRSKVSSIIKGIITILK